MQQRIRFSAKDLRISTPSGAHGFVATKLPRPGGHAEGTPISLVYGSDISIYCIYRCYSL